MPVRYTVIARVTDWQAMDRVHRQTLLDRAREAGARHYRVYRAVDDASVLLVLAELADHDAAQELAREIRVALDATHAGTAVEDRIWEATGLEGIG